jgi:hypothetical protein
MAGAGIVLEEYGISPEKGHDFSMSGGNAFWSLFMGDKLVSKFSFSSSIHQIRDRNIG